MNHLCNLSHVECHCLLYKIRVDNLVCNFKGTWSGRGLMNRINTTVACRLLPLLVCEYSHKVYYGSKTL